MPKPTNPQAIADLNAALGQHHGGDLAAAEASYLRVIKKYGKVPEAHQLLATLYSQMDRQADAALQFDRCLKLDPGNDHALRNYGAMLVALGRDEEGLKLHDRALRKPRTSDFETASIQRTRFKALQALKRDAEALAAIDQALKLAPDPRFFLQNLWVLKLHQADWTGLAEIESRLIARLDATSDHEATAAFPRLNLPGGVRQRRWAEKWVNETFKRPAYQPTFLPPATAGERIRIGFFSPDFYNHATLLLMSGLFEHLDRTKFEVFIFAYGAHREDALTEQLRSRVDHYIDIRDMPDADAASLARNRGLDIAIDLKGAVDKNRFGIFLARAAPLQVGYMAFPGTMGAPELDYFIADPTSVPEAHFAHFAENIVWMPDTYFATDYWSKPEGKTFARADFGLPDNAFVFASLNQAYKIRPEMFDIWMRILQRTDNSVLWQLTGDERVAANLRAEAQARGVAPERLVFSGSVSVADHISRMKLADLFLDTAPVNAHTTAADALFSGLPVLTCMGDTFVSRVAGSLVRAAGLPELATETPEAYEALAIELGYDAGRLQALRQRLAANLPSAPLFDTVRYTRNFERALTLMHERRRDGFKPAHFAV